MRFTVNTASSGQEHSNIKTKQWYVHIYTICYQLLWTMELNPLDFPPFKLRYSCLWQNWAVVACCFRWRANKHYNLVSIFGPEEVIFNDFFCFGKMILFSSSISKIGNEGECYQWDRKKYILRTMIKPFLPYLFSMCHIF